MKRQSLYSRKKKGLTTPLQVKHIACTFALCVCRISCAFSLSSSVPSRSLSTSANMSSLSNSSFSTPRITWSSINFNDSKSLLQKTNTWQPIFAITCTV